MSLNVDVIELHSWTRDSFAGPAGAIQRTTAPLGADAGHNVDSRTPGVPLRHPGAAAIRWLETRMAGRSGSSSMEVGVKCNVTRLFLASHLSHVLMLVRGVVVTHNMQLDTRICLATCSRTSRTRGGDAARSRHRRPCRWRPPNAANSVVVPLRL